MKKIIFIFFSLLLTLFIFTNDRIYAQELTPTTTPSPTPAIIKYNLAYPGILPNHPLYKLKVLRDKISNTLINDPDKKVNFYLLQTDKGILAAAMLIDINKIDLAEETALKAEHNFTQISRMIESYYFRDQKNSSKTKAKDLITRLKTASSKHQEVLTSILKRVPKNNQKAFENVIYFSKSNMKTIENTFKNYESDLRIYKN